MAASLLADAALDRAYAAARADHHQGKRLAGAIRGMPSDVVGDIALLRFFRQAVWERLGAHAYTIGGLYPEQAPEDVASDVSAACGWFRKQLEWRRENKVDAIRAAIIEQDASFRSGVPGALPCVV